MNIVRSYLLHLLSEALSILSHSSGVQGNESIVARESVLYGDRVVKVPFLSGNAIRHRCIREPGAHWLVEQIGLYGKLTIDQANYLFNGGSLTESSVSDNLGTIAKMQSLFPLMRLLGGSLRNQVIGGSLFVGRGLLVCQENKGRIAKHLPPEFLAGVGDLRSAETFLTGYQYTRADPRGEADAGTMIANGTIEGDMFSVPKEEPSTTRMIYAGQGIVPGAVFYHQLVCENVSLVELGALYWSLEQWAKKGGTIGGMARVGHGKLKTAVLLEDAESFFGDKFEPADLVALYLQHVDAHKDECRDWLNSTFTEREPKEKKAKK